MRIGFITYEYPPDIAQGGIATYVEQAAKIFTARGHDVEVFCGSHSRTVSEKINSIFIHRCKTAGPSAFRNDIAGIFSERHLLQPFDIIESPEIHANGLAIKEKFPALPLVVKLHMPLFLQMRLFNFYTSRLSKLRFFLGGLRRGRIRKYGAYFPANDIDYKIAMAADGIVSPSISLKEIVSAEWEIDPRKIEVIPYPFEPSARLLQIPVEKETGKVVSFIGKLNVHKGLVNLVKAIPLIVEKHPDVLFNLVGNDSEFAVKGMKMSEYIRKQLKGCEKNYRITGGLPYEEVAAILENTAVCIFPSIWENFPLVCLEAMSAGRAVVGSKEGGMNEMLAGGAGVIIDPLNLKQMTGALITLLNSADARYALGTTARKKVIYDYNGTLVGEKLEKHFIKVIHG